MDANEIRSWCLQKPRPAQLRCTSGKDVRTVAIAAGVAWSQYARTVAVMDPDLLEALDEAGNVLRAIRPDDEPEEEPAPAPAATPATAAIVIDPETARFELFARLYSEGVKHATEQARAGNDAAFTKLVELANIMGKRGEALEKSLAATERMLFNAQRAQIEAEAEVAQAQAENPLSELANAALGAFNQGKAGGDAPNGKHTNGKA